MAVLKRRHSIRKRLIMCMLKEVPLGLKSRKIVVDAKVKCTKVGSFNYF
jgi:hypothetical protein